jgi:hypothetical protein
MIGNTEGKWTMKEEVMSWIEGVKLTKYVLLGWPISILRASKSLPQNPYRGY